MVRRVFFAAAISTAFALPALGETDPNAIVAGIWPDRIVFFDQTRESFSEGLRLRHGAVTDAGHTHDRSKLFLVTNRMESVEVLDVAKREIVDELTLSTGEHRIRIFNVFPNASGTKVYLTVNVMRLQVDRFIQVRDYELVHYDLERDEVLDRFSLPPEVRGSYPRLFVPDDESVFYVLGRDIHVIDAASHEVRDTLELTKPLWSGYGGLRGVRLFEAEASGVFYGIYRTEDPVQEKELFGLALIDVPQLRVETFDLGPKLDVGRAMALSPDKKRLYVGMTDMVVVDMEKKKVLRRKEGFERGRTNMSLIVSHDGTKLYASGVGDTVWVYDADTLELLKTVFAGGDFMAPPLEIPAAAR